MLIDTHCHLDFKDFDSDRDGVIDRARKAGVEKIINVASSVDGTRMSIELASKYEGLYASIGVHPHEATSVNKDTIVELRQLASNPKVVAVGEVGLDYYRNRSPKDAQVSAFKRFINLALEIKRPLILHSREAEGELLDILEAEAGHAARGVVHCFSGDKGFLERCLGMGLYVSFTCNITFKNAKGLREVAALVPPERLLLETDAPFLAPQEYRGKRNEPAYMTALVKEWSAILKLSEDDIARITTHNANRLFGLGLGEESRIAYRIRDSLYLNITNRCTNACDFCIRNTTPFVKGHNLRLEREPTVKDLLDAIEDPSRYKEIVFCGYGEPTTRLDVVKEVAAAVKRAGGRTRLVTNGHGDLINRRPIAKELSGVIDSASVSLNTDSAGLYEKFCKSEFGSQTYEKIQVFIKSCVAAGIRVEVTCLDLPGVDLKKCEAIARVLGAEFRSRSLGVVG